MEPACANNFLVIWTQQNEVTEIFEEFPFWTAFGVWSNLRSYFYVNMPLIEIFMDLSLIEVVLKKFYEN
jgi:hypothetical protein